MGVFSSAANQALLEDVSPASVIGDLVSMQLLDSSKIHRLSRP